MDPSPEVTRIQFYVDESTRDAFYQVVFQKFGKTSGGAVSEAGAEALKDWIKKWRDTK